MRILYNQTATLWQQTGNDGFGGKTFSLPTLIPVRWEDVEEIFNDFEGKELRSKARVYVDNDTEINNEDYMYLGDLTSENDPRSIIDCYTVKKTSKIQTINSNFTTQELMLI